MRQGRSRSISSSELEIGVESDSHKNDGPLSLNPLFQDLAKQSPRFLGSVLRMHPSIVERHGRHGVDGPESSAICRWCVNSQGQADSCEVGLQDGALDNLLLDDPLDFTRDCDR